MQALLVRGLPGRPREAIIRRFAWPEPDRTGLWEVMA